MYNNENLILVVILPHSLLGQLIREDNGLLSKTYVYTYDNAGNIKSKKTYALTAAGASLGTPTSTRNYGYSASDWGDMLTSYAGTAITYDAIGNPLSYYNGSSYSFAWTGRQLSSVSKGGYTYNFTYNDAGIRTSKTKNGVTTTYYLNGSQIMAEETNGNITVYVYDASGLPIGMQYRGANYSANTWDTYWYEKNLFGDIVAIYNHSGTKLVSYVYDAWGNFTTTYHNGTASTSVVAKNPFKYRGYYYDADLGLYYLQTRYYDSNTGRFISPDDESVITATPNALTDKNLYAYCDNNSISLICDFSNTAGVVSGKKAHISVYFLTGAEPQENLSYKNPSIAHWNNKWFATESPGFFDLSNEGFEIINWGLSIYKGSLSADNSAPHSLYVSAVNVSVYAGVNYKQGIGVDVGASAFEFGYDGNVFDASVEVLSIGFTYMYKDGNLELGLGLGFLGFSASIDIYKLWSWSGG